MLDCFPAYLDPALAPEDFLEWIGSWVGATPDETWPLERRRAFVASATELFRMRGTAAGLAAHVADLHGRRGRDRRARRGGLVARRRRGRAGRASPDLFIRVRVKDPKAVPAARLEALVAASKPAHVPHRMEIVKA